MTISDSREGHNLVSQLSFISSRDSLSYLTCSKLSQSNSEKPSAPLAIFWSWHLQPKWHLLKDWPRKLFALKLRDPNGKLLDWCHIAGKLTEWDFQIVYLGERYQFNEWLCRVPLDTGNEPADRLLKAEPALLYQRTELKRLIHWSQLISTEHRFEYNTAIDRTPRIFLGHWLLFLLLPLFSHFFSLVIFSFVHTHTRTHKHI